MKVWRTLFVTVALCYSGVALSDQALAQKSVEKCTPESALIAASMDAMNRDAAFGPRLEAKMKEAEAILARYPNHEHDTQPVMNFLSPADNVRMTEVLAQSGQLNFYSLFEEQLARDADVMMDMLALAQAARDGKTDLMARALPILKADDEGKPRTGGREEAAAVYVVLLRHIFKDNTTALPDPTSKDACSVDLAITMEGDRAFADFKAANEKDPELAELFRLRAKYKVPDGQGFDPSAMPASEAGYVSTLQASVGARIGRARDYQLDLQNIRRVYAISRLKYEQQREDLVQVAGASDQAALASMNALDQSRFKTLPPDSQKMWNLWDRINREVPSLKVQFFKKAHSTRP